MGDPIKDKMVVVDHLLKVHGIKRLRIADAGVFPDIPTINPMFTVMAVGERAAQLIASEEGWQAKLSANL
jgi:choline dehydrogenase-like flavoprotein